MIRLFIADDHSILRQGLKHLLALYEDIDVIAEAFSGEHLLDLLPKYQPDVLTLDIYMPGLSGVPLIETLKEQYPDLPIIVLTMHNEPQIARQAIRSGARGYLSKDCDAETLIEAIRKVADGGRFIQPEVAERLAFEVEYDYQAATHDCLSKREFHVFCLLAKGIGINDIARQLDISHKTVSTHKFRLMQKMNFSSHTELVRYALDHKLIN